MAILNDKIRSELREFFKQLPKTVTIKYFSQEMECRFCKETRELLEELNSVSEGKIKLEVVDFLSDKDEAIRMNISRIPAIAVLDDKDYGIRFFGIPSGYEFTSLIEAIKLVSTGKSILSDETKAYLEKLEKDVHLQVFVTPTCPYCPGSVVLAHQMAYVSPRVRGEMVEATEFPQLSQKYNVYGVPRTVINDKEFIEGAATESQLVEKIKESLKNPA